ANAVAPPFAGARRPQVTPTGDGAAGRRMAVVLARRRVTPQEVATAIAVEIAAAGDLPVEVRYRAYVALAGDRGAVHEVHVVLAGRLVAPDDIVAMIAVEIP